MPELKVAPTEIYAKSCISIPCEYYDKDLQTRVALDVDGFIVTGKDIKPERVKKIGLQASSPFYAHKWNVGDKKGEAQTLFWKRHELAEISGGHNDNLQNHMFDVVIPEEIQEQKFTDMKLKGAIYNYVAALEDNEAEMRNLAFYYEVIPTNKLKDEIFYLLADFNIGRLMQKDVMYNFFDVYTKDTEDVRMNTTVKKAIAFGLFEKKNGTYFLNNSIVGSNFDALIAYCKENKEIYDSLIVSQVNQKDTFKAEVKTSKVSGDPTSVNHVADALEIKRLREDAKKLKISSHQVKRPDKLRTEIQAAEAKYAKAKGLGIDTNKIKLVDELDDLIAIAEKNLMLQPV